MAVYTLIHMTMTSILQLTKNEHIVQTTPRVTELPIFISRLDVIYLGIISQLLLFSENVVTEKNKYV